MVASSRGREREHPRFTESDAADQHQDRCHQGHLLNLCTRKRPLSARNRWNGPTAPVLEVLENREKATVLAYLQKAKQEGLLASVEEVTTDMWSPYVEAAREAFDAKVALTIDRFHVMKTSRTAWTRPAETCSGSWRRKSGNSSRAVVGCG